jgi:hypothetical protein
MLGGFPIDHYIPRYVSRRIRLTNEALRGPDDGKSTTLLDDMTRRKKKGSTLLRRFIVANKRASGLILIIIENRELRELAY